MPNGLSDVGVGAPNSETYTDNGDGTVTDTVTGLICLKAVAAGLFTQPQAVAFCPTLNLGTHNDWRLPTIIELVSIVDLGQANPSINGTAFPATPASAFWSSSPLAGSPTYCLERLFRPRRYEIRRHDDCELCTLRALRTVFSSFHPWPIESEQEQVNMNATFSRSLRRGRAGQRRLELVCLREQRLAGRYTIRPAEQSSTPRPSSPGSRQFRGRRRMLGRQPRPIARP